MALLTYADRVAETTTTTGTGTIQLGGAVDGKFRTFVAGAGSGNTVPYVLVHRTANEWEVGYGVVTSGSPDTLTRAGVYSSSNGGAAVNFSAGTKDVFLGLPAGKTVTFDDTTGAVTIASATVSGNLAVDTNTLYVDAANNRVGIGTASPGQLLDVEASASVAQLRSTSTTAANAPRLRFNHAGNDSFDLRGGDGLSFLASAATEVMRINASGNLTTVGSMSGTLLSANSDSNGVVNNGSFRNASNGTSAFTRIRVGNDTSANAFTIDVSSSTNTLGGDVVRLWNQTSPGALSLGTDGNERARITAGGYFKASNDGTYGSVAGPYHELRSDANNATFVIANTNGSYTDDLIYGNTTTAAGTGFKFMRLDANGVEQFRVRGDGNVYNTNGTYGTISDAKLKQDITDAGSQWDDLKAIRFRKYRFKSDVEAKGDDAPYLLGVVAQELRETSPGLVDAHPDTEQVEVEVEVEKTRPVMHEVEEVVTDAEGVESVVTKSVPKLDADGQPVTETYTETETRTETRQTGTETLSVKQSILLMKAAVALQEAMARIETLEARLAALEAK